MDQTQEQEYAPQHTQSKKLHALLDRMIIASTSLFVVAIAGFIISMAFARYPLLQTGMAALTTFLLVMVAIPLIIRHVYITYHWLNILNDDGDENYMFILIGAGAICLILALEVVNSIIYANPLSYPQQFLFFTELILLGFQLRRLIFVEHDK